MNAPIHILVVDDEPAVRTLLRQGFELEGYSVSEAGSKARLLDVLDSESISLITLDLELGRENGLDLAREIRAKHNIPIMMVTGKSAPDDRLVGLESGADDYITKPFHNVDLTAATWLNDENKSDRPHVVPLPPWSRELIQEALGTAKGAFLFPSPVGDPTADDAEPVKPHALSTALRRAQRSIAKNGKPAEIAEGDEWVFDFRDRANRPNPISPHDLRRTCSSYLELLGYGDFVRGAILNHSNKRNVTAKHYSAADLLKLKRTALLQWEAALRQIMDGKDPFASVLEDDRAEEARILGLMPAKAHTPPDQDPA